MKEGQYKVYLFYDLLLLFKTFINKGLSLTFFLEKKFKL